MGSITHHIMPLVNNSLGGGDTHTHKYTYRCPHRNNFKKPDMRGWRMPGLKRWPSDKVKETKLKVHCVM